MVKEKKTISKRRQKKEWLVYVLRCVDGSLYTGIAKDMIKRLKAHNAGTGAKYTRGRRPVVIEYHELGMTKSQASKRECDIKALSKLEKEELCNEA